MTFRKAVWLLPMGLILHNLEEFPAIVDYSARRLAPIVGLPALGFNTYLIGEIVVSLVPIPITIAVIRSPRGSGRLMLAMWAVTVFLLLNGLNHIGQTLLFREPSPGVITAVVVLLPSSVYLYRQVVNEDLLERWQLGLAVGAGVITAWPTLVLVLIVASLLAGVA